MSECRHPQGFGDDSLCYECGEDSSDVVFKLQAELTELREALRNLATDPCLRTQQEACKLLQEKGE